MYNPKIIGMGIIAIVITGIAMLLIFHIININQVIQTVVNASTLTLNVFSSHKYRIILEAGAYQRDLIFNNGTSVRIETLTQNPPNGNLQFGVGEALQNFGSLWVGYLVINRSGNYYPRCINAICAGSEYIKAGDAEWFYLVRDRIRNSSITVLGPDGSAGVNGSINTYSFYSNGNVWNILFNGNIIGSLNGTSSIGYAPTAFTRVSYNNIYNVSVKDVIFSNLSIYNNNGYILLPQAYTLVFLNTANNTNAKIPLGIGLINNKPNYFAVGSDLPLPANKTVLWSLNKANWCKISGLTFANNFTSLSYNITAVAENDSNGYGPAYGIVGLSNTGYKYVSAVSYNWPSWGGHNTGFHFNYLVRTIPSYAVVFPDNASGTGLSATINFTKPVNAGDKLLLSLYFSGSNVIMSAYDWNTGAKAYENYSARGATHFVGYSNQTTWLLSPTHLLAEWCHSAPYNGVEKQIIFNDTSQPITRGVVWGMVSNYSTFVYGNYTPILYYNNTYVQLMKFYSNNFTLYSNGYKFIVGNYSK